MVPQEHFGQHQTMVILNYKVLLNQDTMIILKKSILVQQNKHLLNLDKHIQKLKIYLEHLRKKF